jgi:hypothetical protein
MEVTRTMVLTLRAICRVLADVKDGTFDRDESGTVWIRS